MDIEQELYKIKKLPYKVATIDEKFSMISDLVKQGEPFYNWMTAHSIFANTQLHLMVAAGEVRCHLEHYSTSPDYTRISQADQAQSFISKYQDYMDVTVIIRDVFGDKSDELFEQIELNKARNTVFLEKVRGMDDGSTIEQIAAAMQSAIDEVQ